MIIVVLFWGSVLVSSRGPGLVAKLASSGTLIGTLIPGALLVVLGVIYLRAGQPFGRADGRSPRPAGMERAGQHRADRQQLLHLRRCRGQRRARRRAARPGREFPKAMFVASVLVLAVFVFPTLAISWVIPDADRSASPPG